MKERTRRDLLKDAGTVAAGATLLGLPAGSGALARRARRKQTVAIFGGGIAGLTAAHELVERGFDVTVYESRAWGGKARSMVVPGSGTGDRRPLPGEHGYRFEFGTYQNLPDTMRRIPFGSNPSGVFDNVVEVPQVRVARAQKHDIMLPTGPHAGSVFTPEQVVDLLVAVGLEMQLPPDGAAYFANRLAVFLSSCDARRLGQWEKVSWLDFIGADRFGPDYANFPGKAPEILWSWKAPETGAKMIAWFFTIYYVYGALLRRGVAGHPFGVLNGPTSDVWIRPWLRELERQGVQLRLHHELTGLDLENHRISGAYTRTPHGRRQITADWYLVALPIERARKLWDRALLRADPELANMKKFSLSPMFGISYYVNGGPNISRGTNICTDSPWAVSFIQQAQFWRGNFASKYGDGRVHDKLSADVSIWDVPGVLYNKPLRECTPKQVAKDVWEQMKQHVNKPGQGPKLTDDQLVAWQIDPGMLVRRHRLISQDSLVVATKGTEQYRPDVQTAIRNLTLCGDYLSGVWEVATMEAANYNGRRAANAVLDSSHSRAQPATTVPPYVPPEWEPLRTIDEDRYRRGLPNAFDVG